MGIFIRKAFRFGPLRLNLSKRGVGVSAGVTGARVGVDAEGRPYVAGGREGLYVKERLGRSRRVGWLVVLIVVAVIVMFVMIGR